MFNNKRLHILYNNNVQHKFTLVHSVYKYTLTAVDVEVDHIFSSDSDTLLSALVIFSGRGDGSGTGVGW